jgi:hypothetical protein
MHFKIRIINFINIKPNFLAYLVLFSLKTAYIQEYLINLAKNAFFHQLCFLKNYFYIH